MSIKNESFLKVDNLIVEYTSDGQIIHAVNGVSLELQKGKTLGLVGETGAGKTTIAQSILRILPDPPAKIRSGDIWLEDKNIMEMSEHELRKIRGAKVAMVFQDPMTALNPTMRIGTQIADGIRLHTGLSKSEANERAMKMLEMVGIPRDRFREFPHQFSGGMKQRVIIAIALSCNPDLLLADEPTTALDVTIQAQVLELINQLKHEKNTAMLLITHDLGVVAETCDDVAVIYAGEIIEYGSREEIFLDAKHPYTLGLFGSLPNMSDGASRLAPIKGQTPDPSDLPTGCKFHPRCPKAIEECSSENVEMITLNGTHQCRCLNYKMLVAGREK